jgi:TolA-binding protein
MIRRIVAPALLLAASGCLASKSDISLLQDELRATRAQVAAGDSSLLRASDARRAQIAALSTAIDRMNDSLRSVATRLATFQSTSTGEFDAINQQVVQVQALLGQTTRNLQETRAQLQALREQGGSVPAAAPMTATRMPGDTTSRVATGATPPAAGLPGPATLFTSARDQLNQGAYSTARRGFEQLLESYPTFEQAPRAMLYVAQAYKGEGNTTAADSVYQLIATKYPQSDEAATGLYLHGKALWDANKKSEARTVLNRVIRDYRNSDAAELARELLNPRE